MERSDHFCIANVKTLNYTCLGFYSFLSKKIQAATLSSIKNYMPQYAQRVWVSKYLCRYDDPHWGLWNVFVILRIKVGSIPENIEEEKKKYSARTFTGWLLVYNTVLDDKMLTKLCFGQCR
jgi:hypothetical protein